MISPKIQFQLRCISFTTMLSFCHGWLNTNVTFYSFSVFCGKMSVRMRTYSNWLLCYYCCWLSKRLINSIWLMLWMFCILCNIDIDICCIQSASNQIEWFTGFSFDWNCMEHRSDDMIEFTFPYLFRRNGESISPSFIEQENLLKEFLWPSLSKEFGVCF